MGKKPRKPAPPPKPAPPRKPASPPKNIFSNIKKTVSTIGRKTGITNVVNSIGRKRGTTNVVNSSKNTYLLKKCTNDFNNFRNDYNNIKNDYNNIKNNYTNIMEQQEQLKKKNKSIETELKLKNEQYNKLLNDYNIQLKDKKASMDYLTIKEHFSTIEGLSPAETEAVVEINSNLDWNFYNSIVNQNKQLDTEIQNYKNNYSTDDQKVFYQSQQVDYLNLFNSYLFIIYYSLLVVLCYFLYYSKTLSKYMRIGMVILITLYPFIIMTIEKNIFVILMYIFAVINGNAYIKNY